MVALWLANLLKTDLDVMMCSALVVLVLVIVNKPANIEALVASLAGDPDVPGMKDPQVSCMDRLRVGEKIVVEFILEM